MKGRPIGGPPVFEERNKLKPGLKLPPNLVLKRVAKIKRLAFFPQLAKLGIVRIVEVREGRPVLQCDLSRTFLFEIRHENDRVDEPRKQLPARPKNTMALTPDGKDPRHKAKDLTPLGTGHRRRSAGHRAWSMGHGRIYNV